MPFHSNLDQLRAALFSALGQTHPSIEILVVHDHPDSDPSSIIPGTLPPGRSIEVLCQNRDGAGNARNFGITRAKGEFVAFLDSDDVFLPTKIERQLRIMQDANAVASHTSYFALSSDSRMKSGTVDSAKVSGSLMPDLIGSNPIAMPTAMIRTDILRNYPFPDAPLCEDFLFWLNLALDHPILGIEEPLTVVSISPDSVAYDRVKQRTALKRVIKALKRDERFAVHTKQINKLRHLVESLEDNPGAQ